MRSRPTDLCWRPREDHHACVHRPWYRLPHGPRSLPAPSYLQAPADKELCRLFNIHTNSPILGWPTTSTSHAPRSRDLQKLFVPFQWAFQGHTKSKNHPTHPKRQLKNRHDRQRYRKAYYEVRVDELIRITLTLNSSAEGMWPQIPAPQADIWARRCFTLNQPSYVLPVSASRDQASALPVVAHNDVVRQ
jgi:hypothetical protein